MAPRAGFEPATIRLTVGCSTAELPRNKRRKNARERAAYNKADPPCIEQISASDVLRHRSEAAGFAAILATARWERSADCAGIVPQAGLRFAGPCSKHATSFEILASA